MERIGIDMSKSNFLVARLTAPKKYNYSHVINKDEPIAEFLNGFEASSTHLVMEHTGNYEMKLVVAALDRGFKVSVVSGARVRHFAKMRGVSAKTDKQDAKMILEYAMLEGEKLEDFTFPPEDIAEIKQLRHILDDLKVRKRALVNKQESGKLNPQYSKNVDDYFERELAFIDSEIEMFEQKIAQFIQADDKLSDTRIPRSVPGIGPAIAAEIVLFANLFKDFKIENISKMLKLIGLSPTNNESGTLRGKGTVAKGGYSTLRNKLYMGAVACVTRKKADNPFKDFFLRLRSNGKSFKVSIVAVMAKIAKVVFTLMINQQRYDKAKHQIVVAK